MKKFLIVIFILAGITLNVNAQFSQQEIKEAKGVIMNLCKLMVSLDNLDKDQADCICKTMTEVTINFIVKKYGNDDMKLFKLEQYYQEINDPNSPLHNEYAALLISVWKEKCGFGTSTSIATSNIQINGPSVACIPLLSYGGMYKIKVELSGTTKYYLMDSGASMSLISKSYAKELAKLQFITKKSYQRDEYFTLADGRILLCQIFLLNNVKVGAFTLNNVEFAIIDEEVGFLFGKNILDAFKSWNIDNNNETLKLVK
ncbi:MAG: retroviral-like aspartic protease family protein [Bacteroidales bacterium]|jgi:hypothetical protein|nr:retroviral-like aspartic protease family protein [Bacteroidales bacterium]